MENLKKTILKTARHGAKKYAEEELKLLETLTSIDSGTGNELGNHQVTAMLKKVLKGMDVSIEERYFEKIGTHLIIRVKPEEPQGKVLLIAHTDTVFAPGDAEKHCFRIDGDWAYGLGIADCKGGVVTSLYALKIMLEAKLMPNKELVFIYNCDEEVGSPTGRIIFEEEAKDAEMAFVFEPAREENGILSERKGICVYRISVAGKTAHPNVSYHEGRSAVIELAYQTVALYEKNDDALGIFYNISDVYGGSDSGGVPEYAKATVSCSLGTQEALEQIQTDMREIEEHPVIHGCQNSVELEVYHPYMQANAGNKRVYNRVRYLGELLQLELPEQSSSGASDANLIASYGVPVVCAMGPYMKDIHTFNERVLISSIEERTALAAALIGTLDSAL